MILIQEKEKEPLKAVFPGKYIQGKNALSDLPFVLGQMGKNGLLLASPTVMSNVLPKYTFKEKWKHIHRELFGGECWADEVGNPRYILDLLLSIINVSVQTVDIVNGLPKLDFNMDEPTL